MFGVLYTTGNLATVKDLLDEGEVDINARGKNNLQYKRSKVQCLLSLC